MNVPLALDVNRGEIRCCGCRKLLFKVGEEGISYEAKCQRCGMINAAFVPLEGGTVVTDAAGEILYANCTADPVGECSLAVALANVSRFWGWEKDERFYAEVLNELCKEKRPKIVNVTNGGCCPDTQKAELVITPVLGPENVIQFIVFEVRRAVGTR